MLKLAFVVIVTVASGAPAVDKRLHALNAKMDKKAPSMHTKATLDAKLSLLREANSPNHRSKAMEKKALQLDDVDHKKESSGASAKVGEAYDAYSILKEKCVACKLAEDAVVSQLQLVVSLHDYADAKLDEYNTAKTAAEAASTKATSLETARDQACAGAPEADTKSKKQAGLACTWNSESFTSIEEAEENCEIAFGTATYKDGYFNCCRLNKDNEPSIHDPTTWAGNPDDYAVYYVD